MTTPNPTPEIGNANDNKVSDPFNNQWVVHQLGKIKKKSFGEIGNYLHFEIREIGKFGALAILSSKEIADLIVEQHNERI